MSGRHRRHTAEPHTTIVGDLFDPRVRAAINAAARARGLPEPLPMRNTRSAVAASAGVKVGSPV